MTTNPVLAADEGVKAEDEQADGEDDTDDEAGNGSIVHAWRATPVPRDDMSLVVHGSNGGRS